MGVSPRRRHQRGPADGNQTISEVKYLTVDEYVAYVATQVVDLCVGALVLSFRSRGMDHGEGPN